MWTRYVAIGDSTVEGLDDPDPDGGYRGWADRLAAHLAVHQPELRYANLAIRGRRLDAVIEEQLPAAVALAPDLVAAVAGLNDMLRRSFSPALVEAQLSHLFGSLRASGAVVATFTMPDPGDAMPLARPLRGRLDALNTATWRAATAHGVVCVDLAAHPIAADPRLWSEDRLHANTLGHVRIAAALAHALEVPGPHRSWMEALPAPTPRSRLETARAEAAWVRRHLAPWIARRVLGRSSGDGVRPKRPTPTPVLADGGGGDG